MEIEVELEGFVAPEAGIDLPAQEEEQNMVLERAENAQVLLENQMVLWELEIEDPTPVSSAAATSTAGPSNQATKDDLLMLDEVLVSPKNVALRMESYRCFGVFVEVSRVPIGVEYLLLIEIHLKLMHAILDLCRM